MARLAVSRTGLHLFCLVSLFFNVFFLLQLFDCSNKDPIPTRTRPASTIYVVTPTYLRAVQKAELVRLSQTFMLVPNLHWILVEDSHEKSGWIGKLLENVKSKSTLGFDYTHLNEPTPPQFKPKKRSDPSWALPRGVWQRNRALQHLRRQRRHLPDGVVYFADDDNTYDLRLFDEMRPTHRVSVWPVGLVGGMFMEAPIVVHGKVIGFNSKWKPTRKYPIDMAAFAVSLQLINSFLDVNFSAAVARGHLETNFLEQMLIGWHELEPRASNCTEILVWHTRTEPAHLNMESKGAAKSIVFD